MLKQSEILRQMDQQVLTWQSNQDKRHVFLNCYRMMTANMLEAVDANQFHDSEWVKKLLHRFAEYYFNALEQYERNEEAPAVWKQVHDSSCKSNLHLLQCLILGVNAHINYDLVLTLDEMLRHEWQNLSDEQKKKRFEDHCTVNDIIGSTIDAVQDEILAPADPFMRFIDKAMGRMDEYLLSIMITKWRHQVWKNAHEMMLATDQNQRESIRISVEKQVMALGRKIAFLKASR
jgi:hypothetical protein